MSLPDLWPPSDLMRLCQFLKIALGSMLDELPVSAPEKRNPAKIREGM